MHNAFGRSADESAGAFAELVPAWGKASVLRFGPLADELLAGWADGTDFTDAFTAPAADTEPYRSAAEVDAEIVRALSTQLRFVHEAQLLPALGADNGKARGNRAPLWRSELTFILAAAQLDGVRDLMNAASYESAVAEETSWVPGAILFEIGVTGFPKLMCSLPTEANASDVGTLLEIFPMPPSRPASSWSLSRRGSGQR